MSTETIRQYIARLPALPETDRVLHRIGTDRVAGSLGALRVSSVFQPVVDRGGTLFGHQAFIRAQGPASPLKAVLGRDLKVRISPLLYLAGVGLSFVAAWAALACYLAVAMLWLVPDRRIERAAARGPN